MSQQYITHKELPEELDIFFEEMKKELAEKVKRLTVRYGYDFEKEEPFKDHKTFAWEICSDGPSK